MLWWDTFGPKSMHVTQLFGGDPKAKKPGVPISDFAMIGLPEHREAAEEVENNDERSKLASRAQAYEYFVYQIELMASLCLGRNYLGIEAFSDKGERCARRCRKTARHSKRAAALDSRTCWELRLGCVREHGRPLRIIRTCRNEAHGSCRVATVLWRLAA